MGYFPLNRSFLGPFVFALACFLGRSSIETSYGQTRHESDPIPLQRIFIPTNRIAKELDNQKNGILLELPRTEFEKLVKEVRNKNLSEKNSPELLKARYWATLRGKNLVEGGADWTLVNPNEMPALLPLDNLNLPMRNVQMNGKPVVLGFLDGKSPSLFLTKSGKQSLFFDWSLGSSSGRGELHFDFHVPACSLTSLELKIPVDYVVTVPGGKINLSGPENAGQKGFRLWTIQFSGKTRVSFKLYRIQGDNANSALKLARVAVNQAIKPNRIKTDFNYNIEVLHNVIDHLVLEYEEPLVPYEVSFSSIPLEGWKIKPLPNSKRKQLIIRFKQPLRDSLPPLQIHCWSPTPKNGNWTCPTLLLKDGIIREEKYQLRFHPAFKVENWKSGTFQLENTESSRKRGLEMTLIHQGGENKVLPTARLQLPDVSLSVEQKSLWKIDARGATLVTHLDYWVQEGVCHHLECRLPRNLNPSWQIQRVELDPPNLLQNWVTRTEKNQRYLSIELNRGVSAQDQMFVKLHLRIPHGERFKANGFSLPFPSIEPVAAKVQSNSLAIQVDSSFQPQVQSQLVSTISDVKGPWKSNKINFFFTSRNRPIAGRIRLIPRDPIFEVTSHADISLDKNQGSLHSRVQIRPVIGTISSFDIYTPASLADFRAEKTNNGTIKSIEFMPGLNAAPFLVALGSQNPLQGLAIFNATPRGKNYRVRLDEPLANQDSFHFRANFFPNKRTEAELCWEVPLLLVRGATPQEGKISFTRSGQRFLSREFQGNLRIDQSQNVPNGFGFSNPKSLPRLWVKTRALPAGSDSPKEICRGAQLTTGIDPQGIQVHHFHFDLAFWDGPTIPVWLPPNSQVLGARVQGQWLKNVAQTKEKDNIVVHLPNSYKHQTNRFEIVYNSQPDSAGWMFFQTVRAAIPKLPVPCTLVKRRWRLPVELAPLNSQRHKLVPGSREFTPLIQWLNFGWHKGDDFLRTRDSSSRARAWKTEREKLLEAAEAEFRTENSGPMKLRVAFQELLLNHLPVNNSLVLDVEEFNSLGLKPTTKTDLSIPPFWSRLGLDFIPLDNAFLLTSKAKADAWKKDFPNTKFYNVQFQNAVSMAALYGNDPSGSFLDVFAWGISEEDQGNIPPRISPLKVGEFWAEWEPIPGTSDAEEITLVNLQTFQLIGYLSAGLAGIILWVTFSRVSTPWRLRLVVVWGIGWIIVLMWLPAMLRYFAWWPAIVGFLVGIGWYFFGNREKPRVPANENSTASISPVVGILGLFLLPLVAGWANNISGQPEKVFIIGKPSEKMNKQRVLVSQDLLQKLRQLKRKPTIYEELKDAVIVSANLNGTYRNNRIHFTAELTVYCFDEDVKLLLPLRGVQLKKGSFLQGVPVHPVLAPGENGGFLIPIRNYSGQFVKLTIPFQVPVQNRGEFFEIHFSLPRVLQSHLQLLLPKATQSAWVATAVGKQNQREVNNQLQLQADIGLANRGQKNAILHVRWQPASQTNRKTKVEVSEYHLWDYHPPDNNLTSVFKYQLNQGALKKLLFWIPKGLHFRNVKVTSGNTIPRIKTWELFPDQEAQRLEVTLETPTRENFQVELQLIVTPRIGNPHLLPLPTPLGVKPTIGFFGYSGDPEIQVKAEQLSHTSYQVDEFSNQWKQILKIPLPMQPNSGSLHQLSDAFRFRRFDFRGVQGFMINFRKKPIDVIQEIQLEILPTLQPGRGRQKFYSADVRAHLEITALDSPVMLLEWEVPGNVAIARIDSSSLSDWSLCERNKKRILQLWFNQPQFRAEVDLLGSLSLRQLPGNRFFMPLFTVQGEVSTQTSIRIQCSPGMELLADKLDGSWKKLADFPSGHSYGMSTRNYKGVFKTRAVSVQPEVNLLSKFDVKDNSITFIGLIDCRMAAGNLKNLKLGIKGWNGSKLHLQSTTALQKVTRQKTKSAPRPATTLRHRWPPA